MTSSDTPAMRIRQILRDAFGTPAPGWPEHEMNAAISKLLGRAEQLRSLQALQDAQIQEAQWETQLQQERR